MNVNYIGSLAQRKFKFSSSVTVTNVDNSDLFNSVSVYLPKSFAAANIIDFDPSSVTQHSPALLALTVDNYVDEIKGDLLSQLTPIFRDDSNYDVTVYIVVFFDTDASPTLWDKGSTYITFSPLTEAYEELYFLSYVKLLYDPDYNGEDVTIAGVVSSMLITITNGDSAAMVLAAGEYTFTAGDKTFGFTLDSSQSIAAGASLAGIKATATVVGTTTATTSTAVLYSAFSPALAATATIAITSVTQGSAEVTRPSTYFDLALAMAYQAKSNVKLSVFWAVVKLDWSKIDLTLGTDTNKCQIRKLTVAEEEAGMTSIATKDTATYFWGALYLMGALNTFLAVDCEARNLLSYILYAWFAGTNSSGQYVGNKLSLIRITDQKCFGPVSSINGAYNAGDSDGYDTFDAKNVGVLEPISGTSSSDSALSMCRGVLGTPINALMIAKFVDYKSSQECADMITDTGTLTNPVLTNELAYKKIQNLVITNLNLFTGTKRITNIVSNFPSFDKAKVSRTALEAASSWSAVYVDDLDTVTISGGITAQ
jgi:hypothetical protein